MSKETHKIPTDALSPRIVQACLDVIRKEFDYWTDIEQWEQDHSINIQRWKVAEVSNHKVTVENGAYVFRDVIVTVRGAHLICDNVEITEATLRCTGLQFNFEPALHPEIFKRVGK